MLLPVSSKISSKHLRCFIIYAMDYKGSAEEKKVRLFLANLGIDYDALTMEQFANLIEVLKLSKHMNSPISQRGKGSMTHGKGKRKRK